jgi:transposase
MITIPAGVRVLLATKPVDFRRGGHALAALAAEVLGEDPFSGVVVVFRSRRGDKLKILHWDTSGPVLVWKQLEGGAFRWPAITGGTVCTAPGSLDNRLSYAARLKVCSFQAARMASGLRWPFFSISHSAL